MIYRIVAVFLVINACRQPEQQSNMLHDYFTTIGMQDPTKVLMVHLDGCTGCYPQHKILIETAHDIGNYQIVLVTKSKKKALLLFEDKLGENIFFDTQLLALDLGLVTGFPTVLFFDQSGNVKEKLEIEYLLGNINLP